MKKVLFFKFLTVGAVKLKLTAQPVKKQLTVYNSSYKIRLQNEFKKTFTEWILYDEKNFCR